MIDPLFEGPSSKYKPVEICSLSDVYKAIALLASQRFDSGGLEEFAGSADWLFM